MDDAEIFTAPPRGLAPTPARPLLGLTVLVVEDSRFASEAMRLLCLRSGARIRRADSLRAARRHLQVYRPGAVIVDLGLPDGSGLDLIADLARAQPRLGVILACTGDPAAAQAARDAGADDVLVKPVTSLALFQTAVLAHLPPDRRVAGPRPVADDVVRPDRLALQDDLELAAEALNDPGDGRMLDYVAQFLRGIAVTTNDASLADAANRLAAIRAHGGPVATEAARVAGLVQARLETRKVV